jgi:hypothetical protein
LQTENTHLDAATVAEALRQVLQGEDFHGPKQATARIRLQSAMSQHSDAPYSIATNAMHAVYWNRIWLAKLRGIKKPAMIEDWRVPSAAEWPEIRLGLVETVEEAYEIASAHPFEHSMKNDTLACKTLLAIAVHTSYHLGQISLLKDISK